jgi:hypothetical protein
MSPEQRPEWVGPADDRLLKLEIALTLLQERVADLERIESTRGR